MNTAQKIERTVDDRFYETHGYARPSDTWLRDEFGGRIVESSNYDAGNGGFSLSPTDVWEFPDGSRLSVSYRLTEVVQTAAAAVAAEIDGLTPDFCRRNADADLLEEFDDTHGPYIAMIGTIARRLNVETPYVLVGVADDDDSAFRISVSLSPGSVDAEFWAEVDAELSRRAKCDV